MEFLTCISKRKSVFRRLLSCLAVLTLTATAIFFPSALPAFAISPPFPAVYWLHAETSSLISTSHQLNDTDVDQPEYTSNSVKPKKSTAVFQFKPGVIDNTVSGETNGYGWIFDSPLNGKYDTGQTWTFYVRLRLTGGTTPTGTATAKVFRYDGASTYTPLFSSSLSGITPSGTATTYSWTYNTTSDLDMQGQYLYVHYLWQTSSGGNNSTGIALHTEGTDIAAADRSRIVPGSSSIPTLGYSLLVLLVLFLVYTLLRRGVLRTRRVTA